MQSRHDGNLIVLFFPIARLLSEGAGDAEGVGSNRAKRKRVREFRAKVRVVQR
jgi:hypothetical protein